MCLPECLKELPQTNHLFYIVNCFRQGEIQQCILVLHYHPDIQHVQMARQNSACEKKNRQEGNHYKNIQH